MAPKIGDRLVFHESFDDDIVQVLGIIDEGDSLRYYLKVLNPLSVDSTSKPGKEFDVSEPKQGKGGAPFTWYFRDIIDILREGDLLEVVLAADAEEVTYRNNEPGKSHGYILPSHLSEPSESRPVYQETIGIIRPGYFGWRAPSETGGGSKLGDRIVIYESRKKEGIIRKSPNWFASLDAIHSMRLFQKRHRIDVPLPEKKQAAEVKSP